MTEATSAATEQQFQDNNRYAGFVIRACAVVLDVIFGIIIMGIIGMLLGITGYQPFSQSVETHKMPPFVNLFYLICYYVIPESSKMQGSLGKYLIGLKIIGKDGGRISFLRALCRNFSKALSGIVFLLGYIMAAFTDKHRALHDLICNTYVVYKDK